MTPLEEHPSLASMLRTLRIIHIVLVAGMSLFFGYVFIKAPPPEEAPRPKAPDHGLPGLERPSSEHHPEFMGLIGAGIFVITIPLSFLMRAKLQRQARDAWREGDEKRFRERFTNARIVSWALIEGCGFYAIVAYLTTRGDIALALTCACIALLVATHPTERSVNALLEDLP